MAFCKNCGSELESNQDVCLKCGKAVATTQSGGAVVDNGGFLWGLLGFCVPVVGLILFLIWKDEKPLTAKAAGIGALISVGVGILYYIIVIIVFAGSFAAY